MNTKYIKKWYTPMEIAKLGLIPNSKGSRATVTGNYNFVLELIKSGRIRGKDYSHGRKRANWLVSDAEIARYHRTITILASRADMQSAALEDDYQQDGSV